MPNVLLVADAEWVRNDVEAALGDPDSTVTSFDDPLAAATRLTEQAFDVAVVDMQVKSMGGMAIVRVLKQEMAEAGIDPIPVVLMLDRDADSFLARRAGATAYLVKPFTSQDFRSALAALTSV